MSAGRAGPCPPCGRGSARSRRSRRESPAETTCRMNKPVHRTPAGTAWPPSAPPRWRQAPSRDVTIVRPSVIFGADDKFTNVFAALQRALPLLPLAGARARFQPVWVGDVAGAIAAALARPDLAGEVIECAGPEVLTLAQIVARVGAMQGCAKPVLPLPEPVAMVQAALMTLLPGEPLLTRDNLRSMRSPNVASGQLRGLRDLGIDPAPLDILADHLAPRGR